jgi:hypothetical protein
MTQAPQSPSGTGFTRRQIALGPIPAFSLQIALSFFMQTLGIARPRIAADLNGMFLYAWSLSIPEVSMDSVVKDKKIRQPAVAEIGA